MQLEYNKPKNIKIENQELIKDLINVSEKIKKSPTILEYNNHGIYETSVFIRRFGSWNSALKNAGLKINNKQWNEEELYNNLQTVWELKGKQPVRRDMDDKNLSRISSGAYLRYFNTWTNAIMKFVEYINSNVEIIESKSDVTVKYHHKTKRDVPLGLRFKVLLRDNFKCCVCGASPAKDPHVTLEIDHIVPWSKGGETTEDNLQTLCFNCNRGKSDL